MFSVDFGTLSCEGYPQRLTREAIVRPSGAIWCLGVLFHRFFIDFGVHFGRHFRTCCIISGIQFQSVFLKASRDALVMILAPFGEPFWKHFQQFSGTGEMLILMTPPMRKLWFRGTGHAFFSTFPWSVSRCVFGLCFFEFLIDFGCLGDSLWVPLGSPYTLFSATDF